MMLLHLLVATVLAIQAAATPAQQTAPPQPDANAYVVGATDVLTIRVFDEPSLQVL